MNPTMTIDERAAYMMRVATDKTSGVVRGWKVGGEPEVQAAIALHNQREFERCKAAALAMLKL